MGFAEKLTECRTQLGISQKKLAEMVGITPVRLNYWEKGKCEPNVYYIKALARALGVTGDYLLETDLEEEMSLSEEAVKVAKDYDALDYRGKYAVRSVIDAETAYLRHGVRNPPLAPEIQRAIDKVLNPAGREKDAK